MARGRDGEVRGVETKKVTEEDYRDLIKKEPNWKIVSYDFDTDTLKITNLYYDRFKAKEIKEDMTAIDNYLGLTTQGVADDPVNHPSHYGGDTVYEVIKVIEAWSLNFNLGNSVKYIARADHKNNKLTDLKKAAWYLNREIENLDGSRTDYTPTHDG